MIKSSSLVFFLLFVLSNIMYAQDEGFASYYHHRFHGKMTASGRIHNKYELTAAHRTYPFGTFLRVTNLENMLSVVVCVTDRGPHQRSRIIDLSEAAAKKLDFKSDGVVKVRIEEVPCAIDLRYLDLIYPPTPYFDLEAIKVVTPLRFGIDEDY